MLIKKPGLKLVGAVLLAGLVVFGVQITPLMAKPASALTIKHTVVQNETIWNIAQQYDVSVKQIVEWNRLSHPDKVYVGEVLYINTSKSREYIRLNPTDVELLARLIYAEARGEDLEGQIAVGAVVLNRLQHPEFPKTLRGVIYQSGAFTAVRDQQIRLKPDQTAREAAQAALEGIDPTGGALFYYNPSIAKDKWIRTRPVVKVIGNHSFST